MTGEDINKVAVYGGDRLALKNSAGYLHQRGTGEEQKLRDDSGEASSAYLMLNRE